VDFSEGTLDAQGSDGNNILLIVTGTLSHFGNKETQQFVQTFFLESQTRQVKLFSFFFLRNYFK
jgi:hypothetical protein